MVVCAILHLLRESETQRRYFPSRTRVSVARVSGSFPSPHLIRPRPSSAAFDEAGRKSSSAPTPLSFVGLMGSSDPCHTHILLVHSPNHAIVWKICRQPDSGDIYLTISSPLLDAGRPLSHPCPLLARSRFCFDSIKDLRSVISLRNTRRIRRHSRLYPRRSAALDPLRPGRYYTDRSCHLTRSNAKTLSRSAQSPSLGRCGPHQS